MMLCLELVTVNNNRTKYKLKNSFDCNMRCVWVTSRRHLIRVYSAVIVCRTATERQRMLSVLVVGGGPTAV